jgi:hypothetical protein
MDRFQIIVLVILVGVQIFRALKKKMDLPVPASELPEDRTLPEDQESHAPPEKVSLPVAVAATVQSRPSASVPAQRGELRRTIAPAGKSFTKAQDASRRERLRQSVLGKVILDPPPGMARLQQIKR